ncbi:unnamed protein product [Phytophthora lilii]|uniref:Unnamed protein product n=1 Tax=Phytophthora lilii TaxID=2077276 RepID=A0A9W6TUQ8_9STRA|nr:unnamed protein product [Phytophthora lilii]
MRSSAQDREMPDVQVALPVRAVNRDEVEGPARSPAQERHQEDALLGCKLEGHRRGSVDDEPVQVGRVAGKKKNNKRRNQSAIPPGPRGHPTHLNMQTTESLRLSRFSSPSTFMSVQAVTQTMAAVPQLRMSMGR